MPEALLTRWWPGIASKKSPLGLSLDSVHWCPLCLDLSQNIDSMKPCETSRCHHVIGLLVCNWGTRVTIVGICWVSGNVNSHWHNDCRSLRSSHSVQRKQWNCLPCFTSTQIWTSPGSDLRCPKYGQVAVCCHRIAPRIWEWHSWPLQVTPIYIYTYIYICYISYTHIILSGMNQPHTQVAQGLKLNRFHGSSAVELGSVQNDSPQNFGGFDSVKPMWFPNAKLNQFPQILRNGFFGKSCDLGGQGSSPLLWSWSCKAMANTEWNSVQRISGALSCSWIRYTGVSAHDKSIRSAGQLSVSIVCMLCCHM